MRYIIFTLILFYVSLWQQINLFLSSLSRSKKPVSVIRDQRIRALLLKKAKTDISSIKISESPLLFGAMIGIPTRPQLILSRLLYETFNKSELEYVVLHEAGHYKLWHSTKELLLGLAFFGLGLFVLHTVAIFSYGNLIAVELGVIFGVVMIQIGKKNELEADNYSLEKMTNPEGLISATEKFQKACQHKAIDNKLFQFLFYRGNPYGNRIHMAREEIKRRAG